jgi:hypothetical protein
MSGYLAPLGPLDNYGDLIALFVKRAIVSNLASDPKLDSFIKKGGGVLWNAYYRYVMYGVETVTSVQRRLKFDLESAPFTKDIMYLRAYIEKFPGGIPFTVSFADTCEAGTRDGI